MDEWPVTSGRFNRGRGPVLVEEQPRTTLDRCRLAQKFLTVFDMDLDSSGASNVQFLVDDRDRDDLFEKAYAPWPVRLYLIRDGVLEWLSFPRNASHEEDVTKLMEMLALEP